MGKGMGLCIGVTASSFLNYIQEISTKDPSASVPLSLRLGAVEEFGKEVGDVQEEGVEC